MWDYLPRAQVFSAHAEVVPEVCSKCAKRSSILRARGGSSGGEDLIGGMVMYSPRTRR